MKLSLKTLHIEIEDSNITSAELDRNELVLVNIHQNEYFPTEKAIFRKKGKLPNNSVILNLNPYLDGELLRVGGRLGNSEFQEESKHPLILHPYDYLTRWLINETHLKRLHASSTLTLTELRSKY